MISCGTFDLNAFSDILGIVIGAINLIFVVIFSIVEGCRIRNIEKHHDVANWYNTFNLHNETYSFIQSAVSFEKSMISLLNQNQKFDANKAVVIKDTFVKQLYNFKDKFLTIIEVVDKNRVQEFTDSLNEIEDCSVDLLNKIINLQNKQDGIVIVNSKCSYTKKKILEIGFKLSVF